MKAHDVRNMRPCLYCDGIGLRQAMIELWNPNDRYAHGACFIAVRGLPALLRLSRAATAGLTLGDLGPENMKALIDELEKRPERSP